MSYPSTPTPHITAKPGDIAETVLMPGDPRRAKFIAETFFENPVQFNSVRGMLGYTGTYKGKPISAMGSGMGMPSIGIYSYELFHAYDVKNIIRVGSAGSIHPDVKLRDIIVGMGACYESDYAKQYQLRGNYAPICSYELLAKTVSAAKEKHIPIKVGNIVSSDTFYGAYECESNANFEALGKLGVFAVEMEAAALYMNAAFAGKNALCMVTISDVIPIFGRAHEALTPQERETSFTKMMDIAVELA